MANDEDRGIFVMRGGNNLCSLRQGYALSQSFMRGHSKICVFMRHYACSAQYMHGKVHLCVLQHDEPSLSIN